MKEEGSPGNSPFLLGMSTGCLWYLAFNNNHQSDVETRSFAYTKANMRRLLPQQSADKPGREATRRPGPEHLRPPEALHGGRISPSGPSCRVTQRSQSSVDLGRGPQVERAEILPGGTESEMQSTRSGTRPRFAGCFQFLCLCLWGDRLTSQNVVSASINGD